MDTSGTKTGLAGVMDGIKGKAKQLIGKTVGNDEMTGEGLTQQQAGQAKRDAAKHESEAARHEAQADLSRAEAHLREQS